MPTIRFGIPRPDDPEQVVLGTRWGDQSQIDGEAYRKHFPVGVFVSASAESAVVREVAGFTSPATPNTQAGALALINHPDSGLKANGLNYIAWTNQQPYTQEGVLALYDLMEAQDRGGKVYHVAAPMSKTDQAGTMGWDTGAWFGNVNIGDLKPYDPGFHTDAQAETVAAAVLDYYDDHPTILAFSIRDDVSSISSNAVAGDPEYREAAIAVKAMQKLDPRPTSCIWVDAGALAEADAVAGVRFTLGFVYPVGEDTAGGDVPEGDLHRQLANWNGADYAEAIALTDVDRTSWLCIQAHQTTTGPVGTKLHYPTPREMRKIFWQTIGEGYKGVFWFAWTDQSGQWDGLGSVSSAERMAAASELSHRLTPNIRQRLLRTVKAADAFTATGGGRADIDIPYPNAYISTLHDAAHDLRYVVVVNHSLSTESVTIESATLTGWLRNLETGDEIVVGGSISLPALDGTILQHIPTSLLTTMTAASDNAVEGTRWMRDNGLAISGVAGNGAYEYNLTTQTVWTHNGSAPVDDHDGNYGEAYKLHGLCLKYLRTHDVDLIADIEAQVQWHIDIEQAAVAAWGAPFSGSAPYWYWTSSTISITESAGAVFGSTNQSVTYDTPGMVRRWTSIDQMHMVAMGLYAYRYLLRNEAAITANTTLWDDAADLIGRMATFEQNNYITGSRTAMNLNRIIQSLTPDQATGFTSVADTYKGQIFQPWQVSNLETGVSPSSNIAIDNFFANVMAPNSVETAVRNYLRGQAMDMLASDVGQHDTAWDPIYTGPVQPYPTGWVLRAAAGDDLKYANPRVLPSNNGFGTDLHYVEIENSGARDGMTGRAPQRLIVLCLLALIDPTYEVPVELDADGSTVLRSVPIRTAVDDWAERMAEHLPEPTTNCNRFMAPMHLGTTGSHPTSVIDSAFTGYWMMAVELWHLVNSGADYADYYPIGLW